MTVEMIQFHAPNGRQERVTCDSIKDSCATGYEQMKQSGCRLTGEVLRTGQISICIEHPEGDIDCLVVPNGPRVQQAIEIMLTEFKASKVTELLKNL